MRQQSYFPCIQYIHRSCEKAHPNISRHIAAAEVCIRYISLYPSNTAPAGSAILPLPDAAETCPSDDTQAGDTNDIAAGGTMRRKISLGTVSAILSIIWEIFENQEEN